MNARELVFGAVLASATFAATTLASRESSAEDAGAGDAGAPAREKLEGTKLDALLGDIAKARKDVRTLRAAFTQERKISLLATSVRSRGELLFGAPDRLRWDLAAPDDVVYFVGPEGLTYRTKSSSATVPAGGANVARALGDLRALLTGALSALRERYTLAESRGATDVEIAGTAKDKNASVRSFTLVLDKGLVTPLRARLVEGKSDTIDLVFSNVVVNGPIDPKQLRP